MKIQHTNFKKEFLAVRKGICTFDSWFCIDRYWDGKLITISVKHHQITFDFRGDLMDEFIRKTFLLPANKKGEIRLEFNSCTFYLYYPRFIKTNVNIGLQADTRFLITWFNKWSEYKTKSIAIKVLGLGVGFRKDYDKKQV